MDQQKVFNNDKSKKENRIRHENIELEKSLVRERRFLSSYTNEEFIEYELSRIKGITRKFLTKFLKKYGYIKTNIGSVKMNDNDSVINIYSVMANNAK